MRETPPVKFKSIEDLKESLHLIGIHHEPIDPHKDQSIAVIRDSGRQLVQIVKDDRAFWERIYEEYVAGNLMGVLHEIELDDLLLDVFVDLGNNTPSLDITVINKQWAEERTKFLKRTFSPDGFPKEEMDKRIFNVETLASRLNVNEMESLPSIHTKKVDTNEIKDSLGLGLDANISELVHLFRAMGFETTASCGGHDDRPYGPYVDFRGDQLEKVIGFLLAWQKAGGLKYVIIRFGKFGDAVRMEGLPGADFQEKKQDIDDLIEYINDKTGGLPMAQLSSVEIKQRMIRKIRKMVKRLCL